MKPNHRTPDMNLVDRNACMRGNALIGLLALAIVSASGGYAIDRLRVGSPEVHTLADGLQAAVYQNID